jgi:superfamily II DNA or RNA helicase
VLTKAERLRMQQLRLRAWAEQRRASEDDGGTAKGSHPKVARTGDWALRAGLELHPWQRRAADAWFEKGGRGTIKVVTGAGKTVLALAIAERLHRRDPELRVAIVVPTIVLMNQWHDVLLRQTGLAPDAIGLLGGGKSDSFDEQRRVLIAVLATARKELPRIVDEADMGEHLLLIADECHRVGAPEMSAVLKTRRTFSLGLSATPERDEDEGADAAGTSALEGLGPIVYDMSFADAVREGILPPFEVHHFGLPLTGEEARQYESLSRSLTELRRELRAASPAARKAGSGEGLLAWARRVSGRGSGQLAGVAARFVSDTRRRKQLLYRAENRKLATVALVQEALAQRKDARVILFHESIDEVVELFETLVRSRVPAVMEHSELPQELRDTTLDLFRAGTARVIVSARSLIEGFDVPEADLGIIVASSSSPRQRIQSIGRVLRRVRDASGEEKSSRICVLYMRDTVDETIYEKEDWDRLIGLDRNRYFLWDPPADPVEKPQPPREAIPPEGEIDFNSLSFGAPYPGRYEGVDYSTDSLGNVLDPDGRVALNPQQAPAVVAQLRGRPGRFRVTREGHGLLVRQPLGDDRWETLFAGVLAEPFQFGSPGHGQLEIDASALSPGDPYRGPLEPAHELRFRQRQGGMIARRIRGGEAFARGPEADRAVEAIRNLGRTEGPVSKIFLNELGHLFWREAGAARFIASLNGDLEFPSLEKT